MKVLVAVKHAVDHNLKPSVDPMTGHVDLSQARKTINPFDEISIEEAVRLKERGQVSEIWPLRLAAPTPGIVCATPMRWGLTGRY